MARALLYALTLLGLQAVAWGLMVNQQRHQRSQQRPSTALWAVSAAATMIRKSKAKENEKLLEQMKSNPEHPINLFLKDGTRPLGIMAPVDFYKTCMVNRLPNCDTVTIMPEYNKKTKTGFIAGMPPPEIMGGVLRDAGAKAIVASLVSLALFHFQVLFSVAPPISSPFSPHPTPPPPPARAGPPLRRHIRRRV